MDCATNHTSHKDKVVAYKQYINSLALLYALALLYCLSLKLYIFSFTDNNILQEEKNIYILLPRISLIDIALYICTYFNINQECMYFNIYYYMII